MFGYNILITIVVLPLAFTSGPVTTTEVLLLWMIASLGGLAWAILLLFFAWRGAPRAAVASEEVPVREGLVMLPTLIGPWLLLFAVRYLLGISAGGAAVAQFSLSWTLVDLAYLAAVNVPTLYARDLILGTRRPARVFALSASILLTSTTVGFVLLVAYVAAFAPDYELSIATTLILTFTGILRVALATWLPRSAVTRRQGRVSGAFLFSGVLIVGVMAGLGVTSVEVASILLAVGYGFVVYVQVRGLHGTLPAR